MCTAAIIGIIAITFIDQTTTEDKPPSTPINTIVIVLVITVTVVIVAITIIIAYVVKKCMVSVINFHNSQCIYNSLHAHVLQ